MLARVLADFDDLATREVYADSLGDDPRGELISIACALATAGVPTIAALVASDLTGEPLARCAAQHRRAQQLHVTHLAEWRRPYERSGIDVKDMSDGFVTAAYAWCRDDESVAALGELLAREPVRRLELGVTDGELLRDALARLPLANIRHLALRNATVIDAALTAAMPRLRKLELGYVEDPDVVAAVVAPGLEAVTIRVEEQRTVDVLAARFGPQLRRVDLEGSRGLDAPRVFDAFSTAEHLGLAFASIQLGNLAVGTRVPPSIDITDVRTSPHGLAALAAGGVRVLRATIAGEAELVAVLQSPALESLGLSKRPSLDVPDGFGRLLAATPRRLRTLELDYQEFTPATIAALIHAHDFEVLRIGGNDFQSLARAFADSPRAARLRELVLRIYRLDDDSVKTLANAATLRRLRKLGAARTHLSVRGLRAIAAAGLDDLIQLDVAQNPVRIGPEWHARPAFASVWADDIGSETARAANRAFGVQRETPPRLVVLAADHHRVSEVREVLEAKRLSPRDGNGYLEVDNSELRVYREPDPACALAVADLAPDRANAIAARIWRIDLAGRQAAPSRRVARVLARAFDGVVWDLANDTLVEP